MLRRNEVRPLGGRRGETTTFVIEKTFFPREGRTSQGKLTAIGVGGDGLPWGNLSGEID